MEGLHIKNDNNEKLIKGKISNFNFDRLNGEMELQISSEVPVVNICSLEIDPEIAGLIPGYLAQKHKIIPVSLENDELSLAMANPYNVVAIDDVKRQTGFEVKPLQAYPEEIEEWIERFFGIKESVEKIIEGIEQPFHSTPGFAGEEREDFVKDELGSLAEISGKTPTSAPIIQVVNSLVEQAIKRNASDIHLEPQKGGIRIRFRVDGILQNVTTPPKHVQNLLISRIKIMAGLDITKKRLPQDGSINFDIAERRVDLRVSIVPTIFGEKVVLRLLHKDRVIFPLDKLGFQKEHYSEFLDLIKRNRGMLLVTGPTGCGKTTTLYSVINQLNTAQNNVITIEDPVEYQLKNVNQIQVDEKIGFSFATGLRAVLRQDPDVIMVGEIRDVETARIAIRSALTGHLVFSTLHTSDAISTISRLLDMGIAPYLLSSAVDGIVSQRLVRTICSNCFEPYTPTDEEMEWYKRYKKSSPAGLTGQDISTDSFFANFYHGKGCGYCSNTGYKGRTAVYEMLVLTPRLKKMLLKGVSQELFREQAIREGCVPLLDSAVKKLEEGITTFKETIKITF